MCYSPHPYKQETRGLDTMLLRSFLGGYFYAFKTTLGKERFVKNSEIRKNPEYSQAMVSKIVNKHGQSICQSLSELSQQIRPK